MKNVLRKQLYHAFDAPSPPRKKEFLENINYPKMRWKDFLFCQLGYIQMKVWIVSAMLLLAGMIFATTIQQGDIKLLWAVSAMLPFLALMSVTEIIRSSSYGMAEIEMSSRYNLRTVLFVRMGILGTENLILLLSAIPVLQGKVDMGMLKLGVYLLVPYLLTCFISLCLVIRYRTGEVALYCAGAAVLVSGIGLVFNSFRFSLYQQEFYIIWIAVLVLLVVGVCRGIRKFIKNMEELIWNSYSIV